MPKYYCSAASIKETEAIGKVLDRAPRPLSAGEISQITGIPINVVTSFMMRNRERGRVSVRVIARIGKGGSKIIREYWRGNGCIQYTFGSGDMLSQEQARKLAEGRRPVQWRETANTVWSVDETEQLAVRRGEQVICMGRVQSIAEQDGGITISVRDGPKLEFATKSQ